MQYKIKIIQYLFIGILLILSINNAKANIVFNGDFETGDYSQWETANSGLNCPHPSTQAHIVTSPVRRGNYATEMIVHDGDELWGGERCDLERPHAHDENKGDDYWYQWSTYFPADWQNLTGAPDNDWLVIADWHSTGSPGFENVCQPFQIEMNANNQLIAKMLTGDVTGYNCFNGSGSANSYEKVIVDGVELGKWSDFVIHIKWTPENTGVAEIWYKTSDETSFNKVFEKTDIPTMQYANNTSNVDSPYFILADYRSLAQIHTSTLYHDDFKQTTSVNDLDDKNGIECDGCTDGSNATHNIYNIEKFKPNVKLGYSRKKYKLNKRKKTYLKKRKVKFKGKSTELAGGSVQLFIDGKLKKQSDVNLDGKWILNKKFKKNSEYKIKFKYFDKYRNLLGESKSYKIKIDVRKPKFIQLPTSVIRRIKQKVHFQATDNKLKKFKVGNKNGIKYYKYYFLGKKHKTKKPWMNIPIKTPKGIYNLKVRAYDKAGNKIEKTIKVRIK